MVTARPLHWTSIAKQAIAAGIAGGAIFAAYLWATTISPAHGSLLSLWQWVATAAIGARYFSGTALAGLGLLIHFLIAIVWAGGYAYLAATRPYMNRRWWLSGLIYGFVVYMFMQIALLGDNRFVWPANIAAFVNYAVGAHMICYGLPVAYVVARMQRNSA